MCYTRGKYTRHTAARSSDVTNHTIDDTSPAHHVTSLTLLPQELCDKDALLLSSNLLRINHSIRHEVPTT